MVGFAEATPSPTAFLTPSPESTAPVNQVHLDRRRGLCFWGTDLRQVVPGVVPEAPSTAGFGVGRARLTSGRGGRC